MHINVLRDIPIALGIIAILIGFLRPGNSFTPCASEDGTNPQWLCRVVFHFVGIVLICFGILGNYSPH